MANSLQNFCSFLEPVLRKVVNEEIERGLSIITTRSISRSPSFRIQALEPSKLQLSFSKNLSPSIFTVSKILDADNAPLQIFLIDARGNRVAQTTLPYLIKLELVVLDGDFPKGNTTCWTSEEFNNSIVKERTGKRPLLAGELTITLRDGFGIVGDIEFTDNSSWIRSRRFRLGVKVTNGTTSDVTIREAMTDPFVVKDHRGELYKKHHPPMLEDDVWRLEKIGKHGIFHKKLEAEGINTVQDFLKLFVVNPMKLRGILGQGMSERMWEVAINHAKECLLGSKLYVHSGSDYTIFLNPICQVVQAIINGHVYPARGFNGVAKAYVEKLVNEAYLNWHSLEEVEGGLNGTPLLTQGDGVDEYPNNHQGVVRSHHQQTFIGVEMEPIAINVQEAGSNWPTNHGMYTG